MKRIDSVRLLSLATFAALAACSGSGGSTGTEARTGGEFLVTKTEPVNGASIFLNDPVAIDLTNAVDINSANLLTMSFQALDQQGGPVPELVTGNFSVGTRPGDTAPGRRLLFVPRYANNNTYDNGGFRAGRSYLVQMVGGTAVNNSVLRDMGGKPLATPVTFTFTTREGTQPAQLFRNPKSGGPARVGFEVSTSTDLNNVPLGVFGDPAIELRLHFDQALNPNDVNVPVSLDTNPLVRLQSNRGRIYLEYDDPQRGNNVWIPADVEIERNDLNGATVALRPVGILPNNAEIRVIVEATVEDIAGESNVAQLSYNRVFATFRTDGSYAQRWNGLVEDFKTAENIDLGASFPEAQAEAGPGYLRAGFAFEGNPTSLNYRPTSTEVVLNTSFTQVAPEQGLPFTVSGGVFNFRNVTIPQGVTVVGTGPNPMVWLCSGTFTVSGTLTVRGGNGARVDTLNSANFAKAGGIGQCGGGNGGDGTPLPSQRDARGGTGRGPLQAAGKGGRGGYLACVSGCYTGDGYDSEGGGSGGGGGTMATQGDPNWRGTITAGVVNPNVAPTANTRFQQRLGFGGAGCSGGSGARTGFLFGGEPGDRVFTDNRVDNNFWGSGIDLSRNLRVTGEISMPMGGGGGGGGGDTTWYPVFDCSPFGNDPRNDFSGGGGGGGGGVLIVKALDEIKITATGNVNANGGNGGGGEQVGSCGEAGGGGAGAGGMVVLMSATRIVIEAHGNATNNRYVYGSPDATSTANNPYLGNDYSFAVAADGGLTTTGGFGSVNISSKYPGNGASMLTGASYDEEPLGGLGGMGIVQLMVPPGENADGTNTRLDDNIVFRLPGQNTDLPAANKRQLLGWRGFPIGNNTFVDDNNVPFNLGDNEGDIRPAPTLMPVPFNAKSRARSKWIDTGASQRRAVAGADGQPRGLDTSNGALVGPRFEFAGLDLQNPVPGYVKYTPVGTNEARIEYDIAVAPTPIASLDANANYLGQQAYLVKLATPTLQPERFVQYEAELLDGSSTVLGSYRIMKNTADELHLALGDDLLPASAAQLRIVKKFFKVVTDGAEGLGDVRVVFPVGSQPYQIPKSSVRIGFALHHDPKLATGRFPRGGQDFLYDFNSQAFQNWFNGLDATNPNPLPGVMPRYIQWDVTFDMAFKPDSSSPAALQADTPRPELRFLRVPFLF